MATARPTLTNRIGTLDFLRGVGILGILLANIFAFAGPEVAYQIFERPELGFAEGWVEAVRTTLVSGKFRGMLALLFGVGMYLQFVKRQSAEGKWPGSYARRTFILLGMGAFHGLFLWYGDILFAYALTALIGMICVQYRDKVLVWMAVGMLALTTMVGASQGGAGALGSDPSMAQLFSFLSVENETRVHATGNYLEQLAFRGVVWLMMLFNMLVIVPSLLGLFLIGICLGRAGVLARPSQHPQLVRKLTWVGLAGLLLNGFYMVFHGLGVDYDYGWAIETGLNAPLAVGYVIWGAILVERGWFRGLVSAVSLVGQMALSSYLLQTIVLTTVFYSWGFGLFSQLDYISLLGVVAGMWVLNLVVAAVWMRFFTMGPVEYVWRWWSGGGDVPFRRRDLSVGGGGSSAPPPVIR